MHVVLEEHIRADPKKEVGLHIILQTPFVQDAKLGVLYT
jgi:hypothetical protein